MRTFLTVQWGYKLLGRATLYGFDSTTLAPVEIAHMTFQGAEPAEVGRSILAWAVLFGCRRPDAVYMPTSDFAKPVGGGHSNAALISLGLGQNITPIHTRS